jgi:hypothetical protein
VGDLLRELEQSISDVSRLHAEAVSERDRLAAECAALRADNERLREALVWQRTYVINKVPFCASRSDAIERANAALAPAPPGTRGGDEPTAAPPVDDPEEGTDAG